MLADGRIIYTRWDYVDRNAVHYQQLWSVRPDGSDVRIFYGNGTLNPVGVWEARPVPGSPRVMATAAAHHAMTAGSIILLDVTRGQRRPGADHAAYARRAVPRERSAGAPGLRAPGSAVALPAGPARSTAGRATATAAPIRSRKSTSWPPTVSTP